MHNKSRFANNHMIKERELKDFNNNEDDSHTMEGLIAGDTRQELN